MERGDPWARLFAVAGAIGGGVALIYVIGGASLSLRYDGFGLPGQQAAAQTPREVLLAAGLRTLAVWALVGVALVLTLRALPDATVSAVANWLRTRSGILSAAALALILLLLLDVWWPLAALAGLIALVLASVHLDPRSPWRLLVSALAVGLVAVAYEADRLSYLVERTCVRLDTAASVCGILIGQQDRGFYLGVPGGTPRAPGDARPYRLVFIPAERVAEADSQKQLARVTADHAESRREALRSRLWDVRVR